LVADVEVGAFLSGGVDSSLVVALAARLRADPLKTFTIGFEDASFDERAHARAAAGHLGTEHREAVLGWDPEALRTLVLGHVGQPFADASILPTALVSALAASGVKVALTGDGGDELFSGYQRYMGRTLMRWYTCLPAPLRGAAERAVRSLPEPMAHHSHSLLKKANLFLEMVEREGGSGPYVAPRLYDEPTLRALAPDLAGRGHPPPVFPEVRTADEVEGMMRADALVYLPQDILLKVDRASMAHSLETRPPFLDTRVVELAFSCPSAWHRGALSGKRLLREGLGDLLPGRIWRRRKQGFGVPVHQWFRGELGGELEGLLSSEDTPLAASRVLRMLDLHRRGVRDNGYRLWQIYIYVLWRSGLGGRATLASAGGTGP
jgi:asparagine synthase (glutamine-hydrolysing)